MGCPYFVAGSFFGADHCDAGNYPGGSDNNGRSIKGIDYDYTRSYCRIGKYKECDFHPSNLQISQVTKNGYCVNCGRSYDSSANFCSGCGRAV